MPRQKKAVNLSEIGSVNISNTNIGNKRSRMPIEDVEIQIDNPILNKSTMQIQIPLTRDPDINIVSIKRGKLPFKKANWNSKFRTKEKNARATKNIKNMMQDSLDNITFNTCINYIICNRSKYRSRSNTST
jgi:hypothetical protein